MNRQQRRQLEKKVTQKNGENNIINFLKAKQTLNDMGLNLSIPEGTAVKIVMGELEKGNPKRVRWAEEHADQMFHIQYDPRYTTNSIIYQLEEDDSDPKWLFIRKELEIVNE